MGLAGKKQIARQAVVVVHHVLAIGLHRVAARALVEDGINLAKAPVGELTVKIGRVHIVGNFQIGEVAKLVALRQIVHRNDVIDSPRVQPFDEVAANKSGSAGDYDFHKKRPCIGELPEVQAVGKSSL